MHDKAMEEFFKKHTHALREVWSRTPGVSCCGQRVALAPCRHERLRGRRDTRDALGRGRSRQTGGGSSASDGSAKVMSCPKARRATPVATRPQSVATPRSMAGTSQCSRRPRPSPHPQIPPRISPNTVTQPSRDGLVLSLAVVLPSGAQGGPLPGVYPMRRLRPGSHLAHGTAERLRCRVSRWVWTRVIPGPRAGALQGARPRWALLAPRLQRMRTAARAPGVAAEARRLPSYTRPRPRGPDHPRSPKSD